MLALIPVEFDLDDTLPLRLVYKFQEVNLRANGSYIKRQAFCGCGF
jgi:hypothetical protein